MCPGHLLAPFPSTQQNHSCTGKNLGPSQRPLDTIMREEQAADPVTPGAPSDNNNNEHRDLRPALGSSR